MRVQFLGWEDPLEEGMVTHFSILAWTQASIFCENKSPHFLPEMGGGVSHLVCSQLATVASVTLQ